MSKNPVASARLSLCVNLAYAVFAAVVGIQTQSWWFVAVAAYYMILSMMRFAVVMCVSKGGENLAGFVTRFVGVMFVLMSVTLAGITYLAVSGEGGSKFHEIIMITIAVYAFTKITLAVIKLVQVRRQELPFVKTLRNISLASAAVSVFSLQRSMLVSFEGMSADNIALMNALTGTAVYLLVFILGINLIGGKRVEMAKSKIIEANEKIAEGVVEGYKKIEKGVVEGYKKIEEGVVEGYTKIEDKFVEHFLTHEGESVEDAKKRIKGDE